MTRPQIVTVSGAAGQIGYAALFRIAAGAMLGHHTPVALRLLELPAAVRAAEGVVMELDDCSFPLLAGLDIYDDPVRAFDGVVRDVGLPREPDRRRDDVRVAREPRDGRLLRLAQVELRPSGGARLFRAHRPLLPRATRGYVRPNDPGMIGRGASATKRVYAFVPGTDDRRTRLPGGAATPGGRPPVRRRGRGRRACRGARSRAAGRSPATSSRAAS